MVLHLKVWESRSLPGLQSADNKISLQRSMRSRPHRASPWPPRRRLDRAARSRACLRCARNSRPKPAQSSRQAKTQIGAVSIVVQHPCRPKGQRPENAQNKYVPGHNMALEETKVPSNTKVDAGWSSPVARQAHNLKVAGSNPAPATKQIKPLRGTFFVWLSGSRKRT